jgi:glycerophosphoryl diester phosphodiesterase
MTGERIEILDGQIGLRAGETSRPDVVIRRTDAGGIECIAGGRPTSFGQRDLVGEMIDQSSWYVAHRGEGDVNPEHTLEAYVVARDAGAQAVEVSVRLTADGRLVCLHDDTLDRTTDASGAVASRLWTDLRANVSVDVGATWTGPSTPNVKIPLLSDVLDALAGRVVVFLEPKDAGTACVNAIISLLDQYRDVGRWMVWKYYRSTGGEAPAHAKDVQRRYGARLWQYCDAADTDAVIQRTGAVADIIGLPLAATADAKFAVAVATGTPVQVYPIARRYDRDRLLALGVKGLMCSQWTYVSTTDAVLTEDVWATGVRAPGDVPYASTTVPYPTITAIDGCVTLPAGTASALCLGSISTDDPDATYTVTFSMRWPTLPTASLHADLVLCQADDRAYKHQDVTSGSGHHVVIRPQVSGGDPTHCAVQLYSHVLGSGVGTKLGEDLSTAAIVAAAWATFTVDVTATHVTVTRTDVAGVPVAIATALYRGGYVYLAAASSDQPVDFRDVTIT